MSEIFDEGQFDVTVAPVELDARKALVGFDEADADRLATVAFDDRGEAVTERLRETYERRDDLDDEQVAALAELGSALTDADAESYDADFFAERGRFGAAHHELGLPPSAYLCGHARWFEAVLPALRETLQSEVEAARAGEAGDGFAVVAEEVKTLAEESQDRASEIESMVERIEDRAQSTLDSLGESERSIADTVEAVQQTGDKLERIVDAATGTATGMGEITDATDQQAASTEEVASMIDDAADKADRVSDEVDTIAAATEEQAMMIADLDETVSKL